MALSAPEPDNWGEDFTCSGDFSFKFTTRYALDCVLCEKILVHISETVYLATHKCAIDLPNDGVVIACASVSKFPTESSTLVTLANNCGVRMMVRFRDAHAIAKTRFEHSQRIVSRGRIHCCGRQLEEGRQHEEDNLESEHLVIRTKPRRS